MAQGVKGTGSAEERWRRCYDKKLSASGKLRKAQRKYDTASIAKRFWSFVDKNGPTVRDDLGPCWIWTGSRAPNGYPKFCFMGSSRYAHRVAWFLAHGEMPICACHACDGGPIGCVRPDHIFSGTKKDNSVDMSKKRRGRHVMSPEDEVELMILRSFGAGLKSLAKNYGISVACACNVARRNK